jgi:hypothetical protein
MGSVARLKMGYYPLPESEGMKLRCDVQYSERASVIDLCVGQGSRRSWRIGQRFLVRAKFVTYAGTMRRPAFV